MFESLEGRQLLTAVVTVAVDVNHNMLVTGTTASDTIVVSEKAGTVTVTAAGKALGSWTLVKAVGILGGGGTADNITFTGYSMGALVDVGTGHGTVKVTDYSPSTATHTAVKGAAGGNNISIYSSYGGAIFGGTAADTINLQGGTNVSIFCFNNGSTADSITIATGVTGTQVHCDVLDKISNLGTGTVITNA